MNKKIYIIQPTYRKMDGSLLKSWSLFNHSLNLPIISATIPEDWKKETCLEYHDDLNFQTDASIIIISCMGYDIMHALEIAGKYKEQGKIVIFGAHVDDFSDRILSDVCDSVFYGIPSPNEMARLLDDAVSGKLLWRYRFGFNINFPFDYSVLKGKGMPFIQVQASVGCKNKCNYCCASPQSLSGKFRLRKIDFIINDLKTVSKITKYVSFIDPNIYNNRLFLKALCRRMINERIKLIWGAQSTVDVGDDAEILKLLRKSGCRILFLGLESLEQNNLNFLNKPYDKTRYLGQVLRIKKAGIHVAGYFMFGLDFDTEESTDAIHRFVHDSRIALPIVNVLMPVPGTKLFKFLKDEGRLLMEDSADFLQRNPLYSVPCQTPFFVPKSLSVDVLTRSFLDLVNRLYTYRQIIMRAFVSRPSEAMKILLINLELRKKYLKMS
jgi:radical SAM superfamily enzyme YgiQ (UPF0313 family)